MEIASLNGMRVKKVCLGDHFSVFLTSKGVLTCGKEEFTGRPSSLCGAKPLNKPAPVPALASVKIVDISAGACHTLALSDRGEVWGWGRNNFGQLGMEEAEWADEPRVIRELSDKFILQISAGSWHSCAWTSPPPPSPATSAAAAEMAAARAHVSSGPEQAAAAARPPPPLAAPPLHGSLFASLAPVSLGLPERLPSAEEYPHLHAHAADSGRKEFDLLKLFKVLENARFSLPFIRPSSAKLAN